MRRVPPPCSEGSDSHVLLSPVAPSMNRQVPLVAGHELANAHIGLAAGHIVAEPLRVTGL